MLFSALEVEFPALSLEFESGFNPDVKITSTPLENSDLNIERGLCVGRGLFFWVGKRKECAQLWVEKWEKGIQCC